MVQHPHESTDDDLIPLADELDVPLPPRMFPCRGCGELIGMHEAVCPACGRDRRQYSRSNVLSAGGTATTGDEYDLDGDSEDEPAGPRCASCGYSLRGLHSGRCPECGAIDGRERHRERSAHEEVRAARRRTLTVLTIGAVILVAASLTLGAAGPLLAGALLAVEFASLWVVVMLAWMFGIDIDDSVRGMSLRLLAATLGSTAALFVFALLPISLFALVASALALVSLVGYLFELDLGEAMLLAFACVVVKSIVDTVGYMLLAGMI